jgi:superfamily II DNA helicase RecQ
MSEALNCTFYRTQADDKGAVLQEWINGSRGWIVATGALETGINIKGIVYVVYVDWLYRLTSFVQQSGQRGWNREVSDSIIIAQVQHSSKHQRKEVTSDYSVESTDEEAMVAFIQTQTCQQRVLSHYLDRESSGTDCKSTDSVFCDHCKVYNSAQVCTKRARVEREDQSKQDREQDTEQSTEQGTDKGASRQQIIGQRLRALQKVHNSMIKVMDRLQGRGIYCC